MKNQNLMISFLISIIMISNLASVENMKFANSESENLVTSVSYSLAKTENNVDNEMFAKNYLSPTYVDKLVPTKQAKGETTIVEEIKSDANYYDGYKNLRFKEVSPDDDDSLEETTPTENVVDDNVKMMEKIEKQKQADVLKEVSSADEKLKEGQDEIEGQDDKLAVENGEDDTNSSNKLSLRKASKADDKKVVKTSRKLKKGDSASAKDQSAVGRKQQDENKKSDKLKGVAPDPKNAIKANGQTAGERKQQDENKKSDKLKGSAPDPKNAIKANGQTAGGRKKQNEEEGKDKAKTSRKGVKKETLVYTPNNDDFDDSDKGITTRKADPSKKSKTRKPTDDSATPKPRKFKPTYSANRIVRIPDAEVNRTQEGTTSVTEKICGEYTNHIDACKNTRKCGWCANKNACMPNSNAGLKACQVGQYKLAKFAENFNPFAADKSIVKKHEYSDGDLIFIRPKEESVKKPDEEDSSVVEEDSASSASSVAEEDSASSASSDSSAIVSEEDSASSDKSARRVRNKYKY